MSWKLAVLGVVVCAMTALVVRLALGGSDQTKSGTTEIVRVRETETRAPAEPIRVSPPSSASDSGAEKARSRPPVTRKPRPRLSLAGKTISVDPGHNGGNFTHIEEIDRPVPAGANGTTKPCNTTGTETNDGSLTEAQFNWDVAQDLVPRLEHLGATVVLTRDSNDGVGPCVNERAEIANHAHADVALSIHADGNLAVGAHGFDVIHPSTAEMVAPQQAGPSLKLAEAERDALVGAGIPPANYVGQDGLDERSDLAGLNLAEVPAVLVELGNMRDEGEAAKLEDPAYRHDLADALAAGIVSFLHGS
jgi:N-acetylmuramoyl-L-alanine amidase